MGLFRPLELGPTHMGYLVSRATVMMGLIAITAPYPSFFGLQEEITKPTPPQAHKGIPLFRFAPYSGYRRLRRWRQNLPNPREPAARRDGMTMTVGDEDATAPAQTTMINSTAVVVEFIVNYEQTKHLDLFKAVHSDDIPAGGHMWRIGYFPRQTTKEFCITLKLLSKSSSVNAIFEVMLIGKEGIPGPIAANRTWRLDECCTATTIVWLRSTTGTTDLVQKYIKDGQIKFRCTIRMLHDDDSSVPSGMVRLASIHAPPSDIAKHLGTLLDTGAGSDVSFTVGSEKFPAHRAILAARSPVFGAELLGSMAEATMASITLHDIAPATFKAMLRFMYTDALPEDMELFGDSPVEILGYLLAAADRYALDRLKILCAQKLWENVSVDTVATMLACAEMYSCPELKNKCIGFFAMEKNFKKAVLTEGFARLVHQFPSIIVELMRDCAHT